jgi:hypothetical protein
MGTWGFSPDVKPLEREANHSFPSIAKVKNAENIPPLFHTPSEHGT